MHFLTSVLSSCVLCTSCFAQTPDNSEEYFEGFLQQVEEQSGGSLADGTERELNLPLDLNHVTRDQLHALGILNPVEIEAILSHRVQFGDFLDIHELQAVRAMDLERIRQLLPMVIVDFTGARQPAGLAGLLRDAGHELLVRWKVTLESEEPFVRGDHLGSDGSKLIRYRMKHSHRLSLGFTAESDAGEAFFSSPATGFDFYSGHLLWNSPRRNRTLVLGDFQLRWGQGVMAWQGMGATKSADVLRIGQAGQIFRPHTGTDENRFLRGAGVAMSKGRWAGMALASSHRIDASLDADSSDLTTIKSFDHSGLHRNEKELRRRNSITETTLGAGVRWQNGPVEIGLGGVYHSFDLSPERSENPERLFQRTARDILLTSVDYRMHWGNLYLFGELARSWPGNLAWWNGALLALHPKLNLAVNHRSMTTDFTSPFAQPLMESASILDESGLYLGLEWNPMYKWTFSAYADRFKMGWLRFRVDAPGVGSDYQLQLRWRPRRGSECYLRVRIKNTLRNIEGNGPLKAVHNRRLTRLRLHTSIQLNEAWLIRIRVEGSWHHQGTSLNQGLLMYQDLRYRPQDSRFSITLRIALFDTPDWDARIYAYENDVRYSWSVPAYTGRGSRIYCLLRMPVFRGLEGWIRLATTRQLKDERAMTEPGLIRIQGRSELKAQLLWKF